MRKSPLKIVPHKLFSSGMSSGWHTRLAVSGIIISLIIGLLNKEITTLAAYIFFLSSSVGLIGEGLFLYKKQELKVRRGWPRFPPAFYLIKRAENPKRFFFHISVYITAGILCFIISIPLLIYTIYG